MADHFAAFSFVDRITAFEPGTRARGEFGVPSGITNVEIRAVMDAVNGIAAGGGFVWVTNAGDGTVWRIDAKTHAVLKIPVAGSPTGVAADPDLVLVANGPEHSLTSIDPATGTVKSSTIRTTSKPKRSASSAC